MTVLGVVDCCAHIILTFQAEREEGHMRLLQNFIQTSAKPAIFYLPAKHTLRTLELQKETGKRFEGSLLWRLGIFRRLNT
jgi:hypothetical protein